MAPKKHKPTQKARDEVRRMAGIGLTNLQIAHILKLGRNTLPLYYGEDIGIGKATAIGNVAQTLFAKAIAGDNACMFFYLKTQALWRETAQDININQTIKNIDVDDNTIERMALEVLEGGKAKKKKA